MGRLPALVAGATLVSATAAPAGSVEYDSATHVARGSTGCGKASPYKQGHTVTATGTYAGVKWTYLIYVPNKYNKDKPMPLILQHPGWGMSAKSEERGAGITGYAEDLGFISVTPQGGDDNPNYGGPWYSWNVVGSTQSPGPGGPTCTDAANHPSYCYDSCQKCKDTPQCDWTTCHEVVTPTGTGTKDVGGYIPGLYDTLEEQLCIDTTREFAAGESNGGMMTYQLGVDLGARLAAIAPQFGSFHKGFNMAPSVGVPVLDIHGRSDTTVPANVSLSGDGYYYTPTEEIFWGNKYSTGWANANGCTRDLKFYPTKYDDIRNLWCISVGKCTGGDVVRCAYDGGHNWFNGGGSDNGGLVTDFLWRWSKPSHIGRGYSVGEEMGPGKFLENIQIIDTEVADVAASPVQDWPTVLVRSQDTGHYGNPAVGCLPDEDVLPVGEGNGRICAPRITLQTTTSTPKPKCTIGGVAANASNGCPHDVANMKVDSQAWPMCLAKSADRVPDPYEKGDFHCILICPCDLGGPGEGGTCGDKSHTHCPTGARCQRGDLRKRDQGVCAYPPPVEEAVVV